jgi:hypothetical protein
MRMMMERIIQYFCGKLNGIYMGQAPHRLIRSNLNIFLLGGKLLVF